MHILLKITLPQDIESCQGSDRTRRNGIFNSNPLGWIGKSNGDGLLCGAQEKTLGDEIELVFLDVQARVSSG